jgi:hypothetical protein
MAVFWDIALFCSLVDNDQRFIIITLMMKVVSSTKMLVSIYQTSWCNIPEDSHLHTCHCEDLKSHLLLPFLQLSGSLPCVGDIPLTVFFSYVTSELNQC